MAKKLRVTIIIIIIAVASVSFAFYVYARPQKIDIVLAAPTDMKTWFSGDGIVMAKQDNNIISNVTGKVLQVFVSEGEFVEEGTIIAQIDASNYLSQKEIHRYTITGYEAQIADIKNSDTIAKDQLTANINMLKQKYIQVKSQNQLNDVKNISVTLPYQQQEILELSIEQCQSELDFAQKRYERCLALYQEGTLAKADLETCEVQYLEAQNSMEQLLQRKKSLENQIDRIKRTYNESDLNVLHDTAIDNLYKASLNEINEQISALELDMKSDKTTNAIDSISSLISIEEKAIEVLEDNIADCAIRANVSGFVSGLPIKNLTFLSPQSVICTIKEAKDMFIESYVLTKDIVDVSVGNTVEMIYKTRGDDITYTGVITRIDSWAEEHVSATGARNRKVKVVISPTEVIKTLASGYDVDVKYYTHDEKGCLVVPNSVFYEEDGVDRVYVVDRNSIKNKGVLRAVAVKKGMSTNSQTVILEGVQTGELIVRNGSKNDLINGMNVSW